MPAGQSGIAHRRLHHRLAVVEGPLHGQRQHVVAPAGKLVRLSCRNPAVGVEHHDAHARATVEGCGNGAAGIPRRRNQDRQGCIRSLIEAAAMDGAGPFRRFRSITLPLLTPTLFFLTVMNIIYTFFETFGVIHTVTQGGPGGSTNILVYKVYQDGFVGLDLGASSAQSVVLMSLIVLITVLQFKYLEKKVQYTG